MAKTLKNIRENIAASQMARLKKEYEPLRKIDMSKHKGQVEKTTAMLKKLKIGTLIDLHKENIPWISDIAKSLVLKDKRFAHHVESLDEGVNIKALAKQFRKNEDENRHSENYLMLAKAFGTSREVKEVEAIIRRNKIQGHTDPKDNKWMFNNIGKYFQKIGESVEESIIMGLNKSSAEYKAGKAAAKKGIKYDANPHAPGVKRLNWSTGHNDFRADALRKAGKPNYGARGQFEDAQLTENRKYTVVHVDKGKVVVDATSSYEAAKKAAAKWGLKSTSGIDAHLMEEVQVDEGTWNIAKDMTKLKNTMKRPMPYDKKGFDFVAKYIGDDELWDDLGALKNGQDMVPAIKKAMKRLNIKEADLTKTQIKMVHDKADELPKNDFIKRYGKDGDSVRYATATNIVKKKLGIEEETSPEVANVLKKYVKAHPLRFHGGPGLQGGKNKRDFEKLQNLALTDMGKFRSKFDDMKAKKGEDNYNQQAVRDALAKAGLSRHLADENKIEGDETMNESYKDKFNAHMKKAGIDSLDDLKTDAEKKAFFKAVDKSHTADHEEVKEDNLDESVSINESDIHLPSGKIKLIPKKRWAAIKAIWKVTVDPRDPEWVAGHPNDLYKWATSKDGLGMSKNDVQKKYKHITPEYKGASNISNKQREEVKEDKAYGPTGVSYYVPKGHPDAVDPATGKKKNAPAKKVKKEGGPGSGPQFKSATIKKAYGILNDPRYKGGNYSGAAKAIEKLAKGLSDHPDVKNAMKRANESKENEVKQESKKYHETKPGSIQDTVMKMQVNETKDVTVRAKELSALIEAYLNKGGVSHNLSPVIAEEKLSEVLPLQAVREFIDTYNRHFLTNYAAEEFVVRDKLEG